MAFLGHIVSSVGIEVYPKRMEAVNNLPRPLSPYTRIFGPDRVLQLIC